MGMAKTTKKSRENNTIFYLYAVVFHEYSLIRVKCGSLENTKNLK